MIGWMMMKKMETPPSGTTRMKNKVTIHGMVRQREAVPMAPSRFRSGRPRRRARHRESAPGDRGGNDKLRAILDVSAREERVPHRAGLAELIRGEVAGDQEAEEAERNHRQTLQPGGRRVGPTGRDRTLVHHAFTAHARHHRYQHGKNDRERPDDRVVRISCSAWRPEEQRRK